MWSNVTIKVGTTDQLLVNLYLLINLKAVRNVNANDTVKDGLIRMLSLELVPLCFVAVSKDNTIKVNHCLLAWRRN